ncbi:hypothetical protein Pla175_07410 [Pirellulimonas nuda]|uniref:DUF1570 domain-containing protein n=1 Tax=Pirellulimonas nuda TaxID=2528009 RepID=A0A518D7C3_9BACT|nr:hypothetical protein [Pirellulimonas nuda]QDU87382.1 hypothetical protein Pla175_07410 [Pirellulimonas nuda]
MQQGSNAINRFCYRAARAIVLLALAAPSGVLADGLDDAVGERVTIEYASGRDAIEGTLVRVDRHKESRELLRLRVKVGGRTMVLKPDAVARVTHGDAEVFAGADPQAESSDASKSETTRPRGPMTRAVATPQTPAEHAAWVRRLAARGVRAWEGESQQEHERALAGYRQQIADVQSKLPDMRLYETQQFLFVSNIPPEEVRPYVERLDAMHAFMCDTYNLPRTQRVWLGKALVFAFRDKQQFLGYERAYHKNDGEGAYGICHSSSGGSVVVACFQGTDPDDFAQMLVHETSHGFIHRYKTKARLPAWVNEGMAEYIGAKLVPQSNSVPNKERGAMRMVKETRNLGGDFFKNEGGLEAWQYGVASSLNRFMIESNPQGYVLFIEALKEGQSSEEALFTGYRASPQQLLAAYGQSIEVPDLRP